MKKVLCKLAVVAAFSLTLTGCASTTNPPVTTIITKTVTEEIRVKPPQIVTVTNIVYVCDRCGRVFTPTATWQYCPICVPPPCDKKAPEVIYKVEPPASAQPHKGFHPFSGWGTIVPQEGVYCAPQNESYSHSVSFSESESWSRYR